MKISIIIPIYNVAPYIEKCLLSVIKQTYKNIEIILIDDCGNDNSMDIVKHYYEEYKSSLEIKLLFHTNNLGLSAARNTGIRNSSGDYVYFLDSDDTITNDCIESLVTPLMREKVDFVFGDFYVTNYDSPFFHHYLEEKSYYKKNGDILSTLANGKWNMMACNKLINRKFLLKHNLFFKEGILHEDLLWSFKLACSANSMYAIKNKSYLYFIREGSISQKLTSKNFNSYDEIIKDSFTYIKENKILYNKDIHNIFESLKFLFLRNMYSIIPNNELLLTYKLYREKSFSNKYFLQNNFKRIIRDFHLFFPEKIGFYYIIILIKLIKS